MRKKRKTPQKINPPKNSNQVSLDLPPFHISFPITLHHKSENKFCYFMDESHLISYMKRCKLTPKDVKVTKTKPKASS